MLLGESDHPPALRAYPSMGSTSSDAMATSEGTIYPILTRLRRDGLVESTWRESPNGPPRRYYRLTNRGREALAGFQRDWVRFVEAVDHLLEGTGNDDATDR